MSGSVMYNNNRRIILATQDHCGICGFFVDKTLKTPHPFSPEVDHIIPLSRGGDESNLDNLQLSHRICNGKFKQGRLDGEFSKKFVSNIMKIELEKVEPSGINWIELSNRGESNE